MNAGIAHFVGPAYLKWRNAKQEKECGWRTTNYDTESDSLIQLSELAIVLTLTRLSSHEV